MTDSNDLARRLRRYSRACVADKLDADFSAAVREAAEIIEGGKPMNDVTFTIDQIRKTAVELIADRGGPLDATWAAYAKGAAELCLALSALAGEEADER